MEKNKQISLDHRGYELRGTALLNLWGGGQGEIEMNHVFIPDHDLSHTNIKRSINDSGFGCESVESATIDIYDVYGYGPTPHYKKYNRTIEVNSLQCQEAFKGINKRRKNGTG
jgi:hypothetical protein